MHHVNTVAPSKTLEGPTELHLEYSPNFKPCFLCKTFVTKKETNLFVHKICLFIKFVCLFIFTSQQFDIVLFPVLPIIFEVVMTQQP